MKNIFFGLTLCLLFAGCGPEAQSVSGARMATVGTLPLDSNGRTAEQANIVQKIQSESTHDKTWYLYIISPYSGKVILRSTTKGKITSSGRRLTPAKVEAEGGGFRFDVGGYRVLTNEIASEDGTYGPLAEYIYWVDSQGRNRRHFTTGGQIIHVSDQELKGSEIHLE